MASTVNEHISADERTKWNQTPVDLAAHVGSTTVHVPAPPTAAGNYYLGSDLNWHKKPIASVTVS